MAEALTFQVKTWVGLVGSKSRVTSMRLDEMNETPES
jgi:hypothetical protein